MTKKIVIISVISIAVIYLLFNIKIIGPISGTIFDAKSGEPIANMKVIHTIKSKQIAIGDLLYGYKSTEYFSDVNGKFIIPRTVKLYLKPFYTFNGNSITINSNDQALWSSISPGSDFDYTYNQKYYPIKYDYCLRENQSCNLMAEPLIERNLYKAEITLTVNLIPKLETPSYCQTVKDSNTKENCISLNAFDIAVKTIDKNICDQVFPEYLEKQCINEVEYAGSKQKEIKKQEIEKLCAKWEGELPENIVKCFYVELINYITSLRQYETSALPGYSSNQKYIDKEFLDNNGKFSNSSYFREQVPISEKIGGYVYPFCSSKIPINIEISNVNTVDKNTTVDIKEIFPEDSPISIKVFLKLVDNNKWTVTKVFCP